MGMRMSETCWAVFKRQVIKLRSCCIWLVDSVEKMPHIYCTHRDMSMFNRAFRAQWYLFLPPALTFKASRMYLSVGHDSQHELTPCSRVLPEELPVRRFTIALVTSCNLSCPLLYCPVQTNPVQKSVLDTESDLGFPLSFQKQQIASIKYFVKNELRSDVRASVHVNCSLF